MDETIKLSDVDEVLADSIRFKIKLDIGEEAYASLRLKRYVLDSVDASNGVVTGIAVAKSSAIATTFFAPTGFWAAIGVGAAATPVGWAIAAGAVGAGLSLIVGKYVVRGSSSRVKTIPEFINTPLDVLALGLFDMIATLGIKIAAVDGKICDSEISYIKSYFIDEWGYSEAFVSGGLALILKKHDQFTIKEITVRLAEFKKQNPDCNYNSMAKEVLAFVNYVAQADGFFDEREEMAIERIESIFKEVNSVTHSIQDYKKSGSVKVKKFGASASVRLQAGMKKSSSFVKKVLLKAKGSD